MRKLVCTLAVRNNGSRLYGKPLQNIDVAKGYKIIDLIIDTLRTKVGVLDDICLAISEGDDSREFIQYAEENCIQYVVGSESDVLGRLISAAKKLNATDVFRVTSESPFISSNIVEHAWSKHLAEDNDATFYDYVVDGCGFEIIKSKSLIQSHAIGEDKHRSELCTLFIRENKELFKIGYQHADQKLIRYDLRLTVDNPEDLIVCRAVYKEFAEKGEVLSLENIIQFLDRNEHLKKLIEPYAADGYKIMYK